MPISVDCPECGARNRYPDHLAGKSARCKSCRERLAVKRSRKEVNRKRKQDSSNFGLLAGGIVTLLLMIGVAGFFVFNSGESIEQPETAGNGSVDSSNEVIPETESRESTDPVVQTNQVTSNSSQNSASDVKLSASKVMASSNSGHFGRPVPAEPISDLLTFQRSKDWSIEPDSPVGATEFELRQELNLEFDKDSLRGSGVLFPHAASPFVVVRSGSSSNAKYSIYEITSSRIIGETPAGSSSALAALSPDGGYLALSTSVAEEIEVFDILKKKSLGKLKLSDGARFQISSLAVWRDRLIALSTIQRGFKVWEIPSGKLLQHVTATDKFNPDYGHCYSPNGKYLAVDGQFLEKRVDIFEVLSGQLVGSISPTGKVRVNELEALGFSLDGQQLCISYGVDIYSQPSRKYSRIVVWDLEPGTVAADFEIEPKLKEQLEPVYKSHTLQAIPGGNRWLAYSRGIVDAGVEQLIYSFEKEDGVQLVPSRKVMGPNWVVSVINKNGTSRIENETFSEETLLAGAASAAAGGIASDAKMPPLSPTDFTQATEVSPQEQWDAAPDPLTASIGKRPLRIETKGIVRDIAVARGVSSIIAVRAGIDEDLNDPKITGYDQAKEIYAKRGLVLEKPQPLARESQLIAIDQTGAEVANLTVPFSGKLHDISPDAEFAVLEEYRTNGRLDIYGLADDGQHLVGWRPYGGEGDKNHREMKRVQFIDSNHIATLSKNYKLVIWEVPSLQPVWMSSEVIDFAISPGGQHVSAVVGGILGAKGLAIFDAESGRGRGKTEFDGKVTALAYHPQGELLAVATDSEANKAVRIIDMHTGMTNEEIPVPVRTETIAWTGPQYLLLNGQQLLSRQLGAIVWSYTSKDIVVPEFQPSDQFTLATSSGQAALVRSVAIPDESVAAKFTQEKLADLAILKPGDAVKLLVSVESGADVLPLESEVEAAITKSLTNAQARLEESASVTLEAKLTYKAEGTAELSKIGDRSVSETVTRKSIQINFTYTQAGDPIWSSSRQVTNLDRFLVRLKAGQSAQSAIDEQMLENVNSLLGNVKLPKYIFKDSATQGLGTSQLIQ